MPSAWAAIPIRPLSRVCCRDHTPEELTQNHQGEILHFREFSSVPLGASVITSKRLVFLTQSTTSCSECETTMAILNPAPRGPSMFPSGILQSSRMMLAVEDALMPSLSSFLPRDSPGCGIGTKNALIPCRQFTLSQLSRKKRTNQKAAVSYFMFE